MNKSVIDEHLIDLYLRLNGYITTGLIIHSPAWGQTSTDIDKIAIKYPYHQQPERLVPSSEFMQSTDGKIDVIFCEIKNKPELLKFNKPIKNDITVLAAALRWLGMIPPNKVDELAQQLIVMFQDDTPIYIAKNGYSWGDYNFRALLCCPNLHNQTDSWTLGSEEILSFISKCLNPQERRASCSTRYNFQQWGLVTADIVRYFKKYEPNIEELYTIMGVA
jgi:hypothetical protein